MIRFVNDFLCSGAPNEVSASTPKHIFNSNGHRAKDIKSLDTNNYILFAGCSHTEGCGLEIEEIYTHQLAQHLAMDYYSMGVSGSGCDVMFYNVMMWLHKYEHKPKLVVLQWPFQMRYARLHDDKNPDHIQTEGSWSKDEHVQFSIIGEKIGYFPLRTKLYYNMLKQLNIPIVNISFPDYNSKILSDYVKFQEYDKARDNEHLGPISHYKLSIDIVNYIQKNNLLV